MQKSSSLNAEESVVDFTRSIPPMPSVLFDRAREACRFFSENAEIGYALRVAKPVGTDRQRDDGANWLQPRFNEKLPIDRIAVTNGTQAAVSLLFKQLAGPGGLVACEELTWGALRRLAQYAGVRLLPLPIDEEGVVPEAFEKAASEHVLSALYCNPTDQNPTTAIMSVERRLAIADIARRYSVPIIEDDPIGRLHTDAPLAIAALAPDVVWYVMGLTKCLAHGMRIAYLVGPSAAAVAELVAPVANLSFWAAAPLSTTLFSHWNSSGVADEISEAIRQESVARAALAHRHLENIDVRGHPMSLHMWLKLQDHQDRHVIAEELRYRGVLVRPAELFRVDDNAVPNCIRLSLSSPADRQQVEKGLRIIAAVVDNGSHYSAA